MFIISFEMPISELKSVLSFTTDTVDESGVTFERVFNKGVFHYNILTTNDYGEETKITIPPSAMWGMLHVVANHLNRNGEMKFSPKSNRSFQDSLSLTSYLNERVGNFVRMGWRSMTWDDETNGYVFRLSVHLESSAPTWSPRCSLSRETGDISPGVMKVVRSCLLTCSCWGEKVRVTKNEAGVNEVYADPCLRCLNEEIFSNMNVEIEVLQSIAKDVDRRMKNIGELAKMEDLDVEVENESPALSECFEGMEDG